MTGGDRNSQIGPMDLEYTQKQFGRMKDQIDLYLKGAVGLQSLKENLWALFEAMDEREQIPGFVDDFHEQWDALEEIVAVDQVEQYTSQIREDYLPKLKALIEKHPRD